MASISRLYRPQTFHDVTDQEGVKETLRLEIAAGKIGHAYLFGGPRGVGKTTTARIFAKALNCEQPVEGEPCTTCAACQDFAAGKMLDVIEMDAASNTGVENVREAIIEHVRFAPMRKRKVYILDEAHMLSNNSWNALLKTVEEPPAYAVFIFITTEVHRVPATIVSRCQRFDFTRISDLRLAERIRKIAQEEGVTVDSQVISSIVAKSDGCLRDGETLLSQLLSLGEKSITPELASIVLPLSRLPLAAQVLETWSHRILADGLEAIAKLEDDGIPLQTIFDDMIQTVRLLLLADGSDAWRKKLVEGDEGQKAVATLIRVFSPGELADMALLLMERRRDAKQGADPRFCLELAAAAVCLNLLPHAVTPSIIPSKEPPYVPPISSAGSATPTTPSIVPPSSPKQTVPTSLPTSQLSSHGEMPSFSTFAALWQTVVRTVEEQSASLAFVLKITRPLSLEDGKAVLGFQYSFHKEKVLGDLRNRRVLDEAITKVFHTTIRLEGTVAMPNEQSEVTLASRDAVGSIMHVFGGVLEEGVA